MPPTPTAQEWLRANLETLYPDPQPELIALLVHAVGGGAPGRDATAGSTPSATPFQIEDLLVFDDAALADMLGHGAFGLTARDLALALAGAPPELVDRVARNLPPDKRGCFHAERERPVAAPEIARARRRLLDVFFWELTYWQTPGLYEELTAGELPAPCLFAHLGRELRGRVVLDAGAGSGRATLACLDQGAAHVYAVEPSPGLQRILSHKLAARHAAGAARHAAGQATPLAGRFSALPLPDDAVDVALSYAAFTAEEEHGGEPGLAELRRVTRPGGTLLILWPRPADYAWLAGHGFAYVALPLAREPYVRFHSLASALRCAHRFYPANDALRRYLRERRCPAVPYWLLGFNPPHDYCWLRVDG
jgi:SAM-dependent methyltransferase